MKKFILFICLSVMIFVLTTLSFGQEQSGEITGQVFLDVGYADNDLVSDHSSVFFRRIRFGYDGVLSDRFTSQFAIQAESPGDYVSQGLNFFVRLANLNFNHKGHLIKFGIADSPMTEVVEKFWGYRSVARTAGHLAGFYDSKDTGIFGQGKINEKVNYHAMLANGNGVLSENDEDGWLFSGVLNLDVLDYVSVNFGGQFNDLDFNEIVYQIAVNYEKNAYDFSVQYVNFSKEDSSDVDLVSFFGNYQVDEKVVVFGRFDFVFDPNAMAVNQSFYPVPLSDDYFISIFGVSCDAGSNVKIEPNFKVVSFENASDFYGAITFAWNF